jgi:hypothetical protein
VTGWKYSAAGSIVVYIKTGTEERKLDEIDLTEEPESGVDEWF